MRVRRLGRSSRRNAPSPTSISTYDGSGQAVHPDVLDLGDRFDRFRYWMAMTPYPFGDDRMENPSLRVSVDGLIWRALPGAPDPIVPPPADPEYHHADVDLAFDGRSLFLYYLTRSRTRPHAIISVTSSEDGIEWSAPRTLLDQRWGVSPAVIRTRAGWRMYYVHADLKAGPDSFQLCCLDGATPDAFPAARACELAIPGYHLWHVDLIEHDGSVECLAAAFPRGSDPSRCRLFHAVSRDGIRFSVSSRSPLLRPSWAGWDDRMIYRSTFVRDATGVYTVWYSAGSWGKRCGIGTLMGPLDDLRPPREAAISPARGARAYWRDAVGLFKYMVLRTAPRSWLVRLHPSLRDASEGPEA